MITNVTDDVIFAIKHTANYHTNLEYNQHSLWSRQLALCLSFQWVAEWNPVIDYLLLYSGYFLLWSILSSGIPRGRSVYIECLASFQYFLYKNLGKYKTCVIIKFTSWLQSLFIFNSDNNEYIYCALPINKVLKAHEKTNSINRERRNRQEGRGNSIRWREERKNSLKSCLKQIKFQSVFKCVHGAAVTISRV